MKWPPRLPDLTPPDFFLWGTLKDLVYNKKPQIIEELTEAITNGVQLIDNELCQRVCQWVPSRLQNCLTRGVQHFLSVGHITNFRHLAGPHENLIFSSTQ